jgi:hydrogenase maturation protease
MSTAADPPQCALVIGLGNAWAGDDVAGLLVARSLKGRVPQNVTVYEQEGEPTALLDVWSGVELVVVVDAVQAGGAVGEVHRFDATAEPLPADLGAHSTHAFGLPAAIELARELGRAPRRLVVIGIEARAFEAGSEPSTEVAAALEPAAQAVLEELSRL